MRSEQRAKFAAKQLAKLTKERNRPGQAPIGAPYWIVMNLSRYKDMEAAIQNWPRAYFRHQTELGAITQAISLSTANPGQRFTVFAAGPTFKVEQVEQQAA